MLTHRPLLVHVSYVAAACLSKEGSPAICDMNVIHFTFTQLHFILCSISLQRRLVHGQAMMLLPPAATFCSCHQGFSTPQDFSCRGRHVMPALPSQLRFKASRFYVLAPLKAHSQGAFPWCDLVNLLHTRTGTCQVSGPAVKFAHQAGKAIGKRTLAGVQDIYRKGVINRATE